MSQPLGMNEFFAMEAGEYLERLDALVSPATPPNPKEFIRLSRALRGSALMASHQPIAAAAAGLESLARAVSESRRHWDAGTRQIAVRSIDDLKILIRKLATWSAADDQKARGIASDLEHAAGTAASVTRPVPAVQDAGTRAFVAREGAAVASALDRAARTLAENPGAPDLLQPVLRVMQPLRGLAALAELPPLPDLLDGIERAASEIVRRKQSLPGAAALLQAGAQALSRATREVVSSGKPAPDSPEANEFARLLREALEPERGVVPIESLFSTGPGPHIVRQGTVPGSPATVSRLELVSHGEHLKQAADGLERADSAVQRDLRVQALAATFRALATAGGGALAASAAAFAVAAREATMQGVATRESRGFARLLREAGMALSASGTDETEPASRVASATAGMRRLGSAPVAVPAPAPAPERPVRPAATSPAPAASLRPESPPAISVGDETPDLIGSWLRFERYGRDLAGEASLDEMLAGPPADPARAVRPASTPAGAAGVVEIGALCYAGDAALRRALSLRAEARAAISKPSSDPQTIQALLEEVFDLVQLGLTPKP